MTSGKSALVTLSLFAAGITSAQAAPVSVSGAVALALAGVVAPSSPLPAAEKKVVAAFFAGNTNVNYAKKISVTADKIVCRTSNVDITARSCELTFKTGDAHPEGARGQRIVCHPGHGGRALRRRRRIDLRKPLETELHARSQGDQGQGRRRRRLHVRRRTVDAGCRVSPPRLTGNWIPTQMSASRTKKQGGSRGGQRTRHLRMRRAGGRLGLRRDVRGGHGRASRPRCADRREGAAVRRHHRALRRLAVDTRHLAGPGLGHRRKRGAGADLSAPRGRQQF